MSLKKRLIITNAAIVGIPLLITIVASFAFFIVSTRLLNENLSYDNLIRLTRTRYELSQIGELILQKNPEMLMEKEFRQYVEAMLASINSDIVVLKKNEIMFSTKKISRIDIEKCLEAGNRGFISNSVELNGISYIIKTYPFDFTDGEHGSIILLASLGNEGATTELFFIFVLIVFIISFIVTNAVFSFILSKSILKPMSRLKTAAGEISCGNLNHEVSEEGDYELRELCRSFEQMRLKLKESLHTQMKYDDNRKMLVSSISHDLKTPITSIKGYVEGIMDGVANTPEKVEKYLKTIYSKAVQVDVMIDDLLLYSKLDLNQIPFDFEKTNIVKYFEDCICESESELEKSNIKIGLQNQLIKSQNVVIDRERLRRVINNIIDNARKHMNKPQGEIIIILRESNSSIIVEINDNGEGIAKEDLPYIFDRFFRADTARSRISGSGLGLAIAKQIIEGHDGNIWVKSRENEGTSIMISLKKQL